LRNGQRVAIKIQYPRIAQSIDSDIANIGALLRLSGLFPKGFDLAPYLDEARRLLREETDYLREGASLTRFEARHAGADGIVVPQYFPEWSTAEVLTMEYIEGQTIDTAAGLPQVDRDRIVSKLIDLFLYEVFEIGEMQSDPNFANYLINDDGCIALLDFGAVRPVPAHLKEHLREFLSAGMTGQWEQLRKLSTEIGYLTVGDDLHNEQIFRMILEVFSILRGDASFDFTSAILPQQLKSEMIELVENGYQPPPLPMDILYLHRKAAGLFLLGSRLKARANIKDLILQRLSPQSWALA
jgi:predicted unusual protein kinase regulating ubiquinone biosynthesis (AarF/ABC1/UbiB family)